METLNLYMQLDKTHPQIVDGLLAECGDDLAARVIAARKADVITDQKRIDLLVDQLAKVESERDSLIHNASTKKPIGYLIQFDGGASPVEYLPANNAHMLADMDNVHVRPVFAW